MRIFICYRRSESASAAIAVKQALEQADPSTQVFLDTVSGQAGEEFPARLEHEIEQADIVVVLVGPHWVKGLGANEWVRKEIAYALANGVPVVPLTHSDGAMPREGLLPHPLRRLANQNAVHLADQDIDGGRLNESIRSHLSRSAISARASTGVGAWIVDFLTYPFAPVQRIKSLSRGGLTTIVGTLLITVIASAGMASIGYGLLLGLPVNAFVVALVCIVSAAVVLVNSVIGGIALNALALGLKGTWRPIRTIAGVSIFASWYWTLTFIAPFLVIHYLTNADPEIGDYILLAADADPLLAIDLLGTYFDNNEEEASIFLLAMATMTVLVSIYAASAIRGILAYLRVSKSLQWSVALLFLAAIAVVLLWPAGVS